MRTIYILEDDENISFIIQKALENANFVVRAFSDYRLFFDALREKKPALVLLDLMLPMIDGVEVLKYIKTHLKMDIPIIVVSAKIEEFDRVTCLDLGADDYIPKPFSVLELISRVRAVLRRYGLGTNLVVGDVEIDTINRTVKIYDKPVSLTYKEYDLLLYLIEHFNRIVTREELNKKFWKDEMEKSRTIDMHIKALRHKICEPTNLMIVTILKVGYKLTYEEA